MIEDPVTLAVVAATFLLAGGVKGVIGLGLPTVSLAVLAALLGLETAMALVLVPSLVTNLWQALVGPHGVAVIKRLWPFLASATVSVWIGGMVLTRVDTVWLSALLGLSLAVYAAINLDRPRVSVPARRERAVGVAAGFINGVLTGMTGSFVVPGVLYLQATRLPRDALVQAMGILFTLSTLALGFSLGGHGRLTPDLGTVSVAAVVPAIVGMMIGLRIRQRLPEARFRRVFFLSILALGLYIIIRSFL